MGTCRIHELAARLLSDMTSWFCQDNYWNWYFQVTKIVLPLFVSKRTPNCILFHILSGTRTPRLLPTTPDSLPAASHTGLLACCHIYSCHLQHQVQTAQSLPVLHEFKWSSCSQLMKLVFCTFWAGANWWSSSSARFELQPIDETCFLQHVSCSQSVKLLYSQPRSYRPFLSERVQGASHMNSYIMRVTIDHSSLGLIFLRSLIEVFERVYLLGEILNRDRSPCKFAGGDSARLGHTYVLFLKQMWVPFFLYSATAAHHLAPACNAILRYGQRQCRRRYKLS
jgi:hypothetical protein